MLQLAGIQRSRQTLTHDKKCASGTIWKKEGLDPHGKCNITKFGQEIGEVYECFRLNSYSGNISGCYDHHEGQLEWDTIVLGLFCRSVHLLLASSTD